MPDPSLPGGTVEPAERRIAQLFDADPERLARLTIEQSGIYFDFTKTHLDSAGVAEAMARAEAAGLAAARDRLFGGAIVNPTEGRAAEHGAERGSGTAEAVERARLLHQRMRGLVEVIEAGGFGGVKSLLHIGIGGSALGPKLLVDALARDNAQLRVEVVSNVDGAALAEAFGRLDPATTLVAIASKTFTTTETMLNAESAIAWLREAGVEDPYGRLIALTASPDKAIEWGIDESRVLPFRKRWGGAIRFGARSAFRRRWRSAGRRSRSCWKGRARWIGISAPRRSTAMRRCSPPSPTATTPSAAVRPARSSPMMNGCGCYPPICSSWRWNRTASR